MSAASPEARERLGAVNLRAEEELREVEAQHASLAGLERVEQGQGPRATLGAQGRPADGYGSVWRLAGLLENVDSGDFAPRAPAVGPPRSSPGANRA